MRYYSVAAGFAFAIAAVLAVGPARAEDIKNDAGKCWKNTSNGNYEWAECSKEKAAKSKSSHAKS
jgi:hypothetical protein